MKRIGGLGRVSQTRTVSRRHLLLFLHRVQQTPGYSNTIARIERLDQKLETERNGLAARRRTIPVQRDPAVTIEGLPSSPFIAVFSSGILWHP